MKLMNEHFNEAIVKDAAPALAPIMPRQVANNLLIFMQRVECRGPEALGWVEAFQFLQEYARHAPAPSPEPTVSPPVFGAPPL